MAEKNKNISANDPIEINELMSLNNDISNDFIEQLQNKISEENKSTALNEDSALFEEPSENAAEKEEYEDPFMRKFNEKKRKKLEDANYQPVPTEPKVTQTEEPKQEPTPQTEDVNVKEPEKLSEAAPAMMQGNEHTEEIQNPEQNEIDIVSGGNITEKPLNEEFSKYNETLDYIDNNVKYSKYVIYIDPENKDFIDSLTVKERKNLINRIIREQDSVAMTRNKLKNMQAIIAHILIAIVTVIIAIPAIYYMINASLEATINNYKNSQTTFSQLYKVHSKIQPVKK